MHYNDYSSEKKKTDISWGSSRIDSGTSVVHYQHKLLFQSLRVFADDTSVFIEGTNYDKIIDILNTELKQIDIWLKSNKLSINILKTSLYDVSPNTYQM